MSNGSLTTTCAAPVYQSNNLSTDTVEMTENRAENEPEREVYRTQFGLANKPVVKLGI